MHGILTHFEAAGGYTACIHSLAWCIEHLCLNEGIYGFWRTSHVGDFAYAGHSIGYELLGVLTIQLVLRSTRQCNVALHLPRPFVGHEGGTWELVGIGLTDVVA